MTIKLVDVKKINEREIVDRNSLIGEVFNLRETPFLNSPLVAEFTSRDKLLATSKIRKIVAEGSNLTITTKNTIYTFEILWDEDDRN